MKVKMLDWINMEIDISEYHQEVVNFVMDQLEEKLQDSDEIFDIITETEISLDYEQKKIKLTAFFPELVEKLIQEKEQDIEWERRHGERE